MKRKLTSLLLALVMALGLAVSAGAVDTVTFPDIENHWAKGSIERWAGYGVIKGNDAGNFMPQESIRRGDFALMLYRMMGYSVPTGEQPFADLNMSDYYADAVLAANHAGVLKGDGANSLAAANITREQAAVLMARVLGLSVDSAAAVEYTDSTQISAWAVDAVNAMTAEGYFKGGADGRFYPAGAITRAEVATLLDRAFSVYISDRETYSEDAEGNVLVTKSGTVLKDMKVGGDVIIAEGVGNGDVTLDGVTVAGKLLVRGGGVNSIHVKGNSSVGSVVVERRDGPVRVVVEGNADVAVITIADGSEDVRIDGTVESVIVNAPQVKVQISGTVEDVQIAESATDATIIAASGAKIANVEVSGQGAVISGEGKVANVQVKADDAAITTSGTKVAVDSDVTGTVAGGKELNGGESATTPSGGGGTGGGGSTTTTSYTLEIAVKKDNQEPISIKDSGYSGSSMAYSGVVKAVYAAKETQVTNGLIEGLKGLMDAGLATGSDHNSLTLTDKGQKAFAELVKKYDVLKNDLNGADVIDHSGDSGKALNEFLAAMDPNTLVDGTALKTAQSYYTALGNILDKAYAAIQGIQPAAGKSEDVLVDYLAEKVMRVVGNTGLTVKVYKDFSASATALSKADVTLMVKAARVGDLTLSQWLSSCNVTKLVMEQTVGANEGGYQIPESLQGKYTVTIELTKQVS